MSSGIRRIAFTSSNDDVWCKILSIEGRILNQNPERRETCDAYHPPLEKKSRCVHHSVCASRRRFYLKKEREKKLN
jgi:hypothetical protein